MSSHRILMQDSVPQTEHSCHRVPIDEADRLPQHVDDVAFLDGMDSAINRVPPPLRT